MSLFGKAQDMARMGCVALNENCKLMNDVLASCGLEFSMASITPTQFSAEFWAIIGPKDNPTFAWCRCDCDHYDKDVNQVYVNGELYFWNAWQKMDPADRMAMLLFATKPAFRTVPKNYKQIWSNQRLR